MSSGGVDLPGPLRDSARTVDPGARIDMGRARVPESGWCRPRPAVAISLWLALCLSAPARAGERAELGRGDELYAHAQLQEARQAYQAALAADPSGFHALCRLARVESELGEEAKG